MEAGNTLALQVDASGNIQYDAILRQGHSDARVIHSKFTDLIPLRQRSDVGELDLERPDEETVRETAEKTKKALEKLVDGKIKAAQPKHVAKATDEGPKYIRYTPANTTNGDASGAKQRIIRMAEMPVDPLEPPKFKHKRVPKRTFMTIVNLFFFL